MESQAFQSLFVHTHDVSRSLKPSSDGELAHAIHQTLHFALDGHPDDYTPDTRSSASNCGPPSPSTLPSSPQVKAGFYPTENEARPYISYHFDAKSRTLALPNPATISNPVADPCSPDNRDTYDITVKFFFLDSDDLSSDLVDDALKRLTKTTGIITMDTLVLAFPTMNLDAKVANVNGTAGTQQEKNWQKTVGDVWQAVSQNPQIFSLGLSDVSQTNLESLFAALNPPLQPLSRPMQAECIPLSSSSAQPSMSSQLPAADSDVASNSVTLPTKMPWIMEYALVSSSRRPRLVTINVKENACAFDRDFEQYCASMGVQLVAHSDRKDILPQHTLPGLLHEFHDKLPYKPNTTGFKPKWALKYTTLIRDRGVLADKGYVSRPRELHSLLASLTGFVECQTDTLSIQLLIEKHVCSARPLACVPNLPNCEKRRFRP